MDLKRLFPAIVTGVMTGGTLTGCFTHRDPYLDRGPFCTQERMADAQGLTDPTHHGVVERELEAILTTSPDATAEEQLRALYADSGARVRDEQGRLVFSPKTLELLRAASSDDGLSPDLCAFLCANAMPLGSFATGSNECRVEGSGEYESLFCEASIEICHPAGRRFEGLEAPARVEGEALGRMWARIAYSERAAVHAFSELAGELRALGAPQALVEGCVDAAYDEIVHTEMTSRMAFAHGAKALAPLAAPDENRATRSLRELALENAVEGCVREAYAALETTWQAEHTEGEAARVLSRIARDETGHAELSWGIHAWAMGLLTEDERAEVRDAMERACEELAGELARRAPSWQDARLGLPSTEQAHALLASLREQTLSSLSA